MPFGHRHSEQEEVYAVISGSARLKLDDEILDLEHWDVVRIPRDTWRALEGGTNGAEVIAFGAPNTDNEDIEMQPGWVVGLAPMPDARGLELEQRALAPEPHRRSR